MGFSDNPSPDYRDTPNHHLHDALGFALSIDDTMLLKDSTPIVLDKDLCLTVQPNLRYYTNNVFSSLVAAWVII